MFFWREKGDGGHLYLRKNGSIYSENYWNFLLWSLMSVGQSIGRSVGRSDCYNFLREQRKVTLPCSYRTIHSSFSFYLLNGFVQSLSCSCSKNTHQYLMVSGPGVLASEKVYVIILLLITFPGFDKYKCIQIWNERIGLGLKQVLWGSMDLGMGGMK